MRASLLGNGNDPVEWTVMMQEKEVMSKVVTTNQTRLVCGGEVEINLGSSTPRA